MLRNFLASSKTPQVMAGQSDGGNFIGRPYRQQGSGNARLEAAYMTLERFNVRFLKRAILEDTHTVRLAPITASGETTLISTEPGHMGPKSSASNT
jgi:hypothetical protein